MNDLVSIIIPTKNSENTIERCLKSIKNQTYGNIEIIMVDNFSNDKTMDIAKRYGVKIFSRGPERCSQINLGIKMANGKYIYRVDGDFILDRYIISECIDSCEIFGYDAVAIHNTSDPNISFWSKVRNLERDCYRDDELNIAARFIRKDIFDNIGMFDENLVSCEDYDLHNRLINGGFKIGKIKSQEIHIGEPKSLWEIAKRHYYYGKTIGNFIDKDPDRAKQQLNPIRCAYVRHWKEFFKDPIVSVGFVIYQLVRYSSAGLSFLITKIKKGKKMINNLIY